MRITHVPLLLALAGAPAAQELLPNPGLTGWEGGGPEGWSVTTGATTGAGESESELLRVEGGLALAGDARTRRWRFLTCPFPFEPGSAYRLTFEQRLLGGAYEQGQFENHWVALQFLDRRGRRIANLFTPAQGPQWLAGSASLVAPANAASAQVAVFLSHTGRLEARGLSVRAFGAAQSIELLVEEMDRHYSYFFLGELDWRAHAAPFVERLRGEEDAGLFVDGVVELLAPLADAHVWVEDAQGQRVPTHAGRATPNFSLQALLARLQVEQGFPGLGLTGRTKTGGYGYALLDSFAVSAEQFAPLEAAVRDLLDAPGLVLDLRTCSGGDELLGRRIAGLLTDEPVSFASTALRRGPGHDELGPWVDSVLSPAGDALYRGPVAVLLGPACASSGERFAQAMDALPGAVLLGAPTGGSSGNPAPTALPNGVTVWYSRWVNRNLDGSLLEGNGVAPDLFVEWGGDGDPVLEAAVAELSRRVDGG